MTDETLTPEQVRELMADGDSFGQAEEFDVESPHGKITPIGVNVILQVQNGPTIKAAPFQAAYTDIGIYIKGKVGDSEEERYYVIPYTGIALLEFDMKNIEEQIHAAAADFMKKAQGAAKEDDKPDEND